MLRLALRNLFRRPLRLMLTVGGVALAVAVWLSLAAFGEGYRRALGTELNRAGVQMMLVPLGCPYDAAARVLKGRTLETSLPMAALGRVRSDPGVAAAAPLLIAAVARPAERRTDIWVGMDPAALELKPWWRVRAGSPWFTASNSVILGAEAAAVELRSPGDAFHSPELQARFQVAGILERSGTSDDALFFVPLVTAQKLFAQDERLTAIAIRLRDPAQQREVTTRLQAIPGAQVVTLTEMMGTFLNLLASVRTLMGAITLVALAAGVIGMLNTLVAAVVERTTELSLLRALGASRLQVFGLITLEAAWLSAMGTALGLVLALAGGRGLEHLIRPWVPLAPSESLLAFTPLLVVRCCLMAAVAGLVTSLWPAWRACRLAPALAAKAG